MHILENAPVGANQIDYLILGIIPDTSVLAESSLSGWSDVFEQLSAWKEAPEDLEDDGIEPPNNCVLCNAVNVAKGFEARGIDAPSTVIPNGDGGIVYRWRTGGAQWTVEFEDDGFIESYLLVNDKIQCRHGLQAA